MSRRVLEGRAVESKGKNNIQRVGKKKSVNFSYKKYPNPFVTRIQTKEGGKKGED